MIVTTGGRTDTEGKAEAKRIAYSLNIPFIERKKQPLTELMEKYRTPVIVAGKKRIECHLPGSEEPLFFHPNSAMFRVKRLLRGEADPFIEACGIRSGTKLLDCTMGLGADSMTASFAAGDKGNVTGIEENPVVAFLTAAGLSGYESGLEELDKAMRRVETVNCHHLDFLKSCSSGQYDVIYFDPMFEEEILESSNFSPLKPLASYAPLLKESVELAKKAAKKRVVLKDHFRSGRFAELGFRQLKRKSSKFHYGVIELQ